jgi:hypothetical protein
MDFVVKLLLSVGRECQMHIDVKRLEAACEANIRMWTDIQSLLRMQRSSDVTTVDVSAGSNLTTADTLPGPYTKGAKRHWTHKARLKFVEMYTGGAKEHDIAKELGGVSVASVRDNVRRFDSGHYQVEAKAAERARPVVEDGLSKGQARAVIRRRIINEAEIDPSLASRYLEWLLPSVGE